MEYHNKENQLNDYVDILYNHAERQRYRAFIKMNEEQFIHKMYKSKDALMKAINEAEKDKYNLFLSLNTFYKPRRLTENISQLENLYIDLDYYKTNYNLENVLYFLNHDYFRHLIPEPNLIINSGQGLYLIWHIKPVPIRALPLWTALEEYFCDLLKDFGADPIAKDATRFLRIPGSTNLKNNSKVAIIEKNDISYTLNEIQQEYFNMKYTERKSKKHKKYKKTVGKVTKVFNVYTLHWERINDLIRLCKLREYNVKGHREVILFLYRYWLSIIFQDEEQALKDTLNLNDKFLDKLKKREVTKATESAKRYYKDKKYKFSNEKLIEILHISDDEMKNLKTIISKREKYNRNNKRRRLKRRNERGLTKREENKLKLMTSIKELTSQGLTYKQIAVILNRHERTIRRYC